MTGGLEADSASSDWHDMAWSPAMVKG